MEDHNGYAILDHRPVGPIITMDASLTGEVGRRPGVAAFNFELNEYFHRPVPDNLLGLGIADYELIVHLLAARVWGQGWRGYEIQGYTDNEPSYHLLKSGRSENSRRLQLAREFWFLETKFDFVWKPHYIPRKENHHSDALSRWGDVNQRKRFYRLIENTSAKEIHVDDHLFLFNNNI